MGLPFRLAQKSRDERHLVLNLTMAYLAVMKLLKVVALGLNVTRLRSGIKFRQKSCHYSTIDGELLSLEHHSLLVTALTQPTWTTSEGRVESDC